MVAHQNPPKGNPDAVATKQGWRHPQTRELLVSVRGLAVAAEPVIEEVKQEEVVVEQPVVETLVVEEPKQEEAVKAPSKPAKKAPAAKKPAKEAKSTKQNTSKG